MCLGTLWDNTNYYIQSGQSIPQHIMFEPLVTTRYQAHEIHCLPPPETWPNLGHQSDDRTYHVHVQFQEPLHMG
jgi:hypothetical protein